MQKRLQSGRFRFRRDHGSRKHREHQQDLVDLGGMDRGGGRRIALWEGEPPEHRGSATFPCGYTLDPDGDSLNLYYGAADTSVALATGSVRQLLCWLDEYGSPQVNAG